MMRGKAVKCQHTNATETSAKERGVNELPALFFPCFCLDAAARAGMFQDFHKKVKFPHLIYDKEKKRRNHPQKQRGLLPAPFSCQTLVEHSGPRPL